MCISFTVAKTKDAMEANMILGIICIYKIYFFSKPSDFIIYNLLIEHFIYWTFYIL